MKRGKTYLLLSSCQMNCFPIASRVEHRHSKVRHTSQAYTFIREKLDFTAISIIVSQCANRICFQNCPHSATLLDHPVSSGYGTCHFKVAYYVWDIHQHIIILWHIIFLAPAADRPDRFQYPCQSLLFHNLLKSIAPTFTRPLTKIRILI
jgi:hypothetical protein